MHDSGVRVKLEREWDLLRHPYDVWIYLLPDATLVWNLLAERNCRFSIFIFIMSLKYIFIQDENVIIDTKRALMAPT